LPFAVITRYGGFAQNSSTAVGTLKGFNVLVRNNVVAPGDFTLYATLKNIADSRKWPVR
jgi:hypothetical protein